MAYEKQTWVNGDIITAEKLNHIEDGIGSGESFVIHWNSETDETDKTWREVYNALSSGKYVSYFDNDENNNITAIGIVVGTAVMRKLGSTDVTYTVFLNNFVFSDNIMSIEKLITTSEDGYLHFDE